MLEEEADLLFRTDQSKSIFKCFTISGYYSFKREIKSG